MSAPPPADLPSGRSLRLPAGVTAVELDTSRGAFAALATVRPGRLGTVLLVPGWTGSKEDFVALLPLLGEAGWAVVSYDQRGQHETAARATDDFTLRGFALDALAVAAALGDFPVHLVGHSFGGLVGQAAALAQPARLTSLTLLCSGPGGFADATRVGALSRMVELLDTATLGEVYLAKQEYDASRRAGAAPSPDVARFLRQRFLTNHRLSLAAITSLLVTAEDRTDALAKLDLPIHVVYGVDDDGWPPAVQDTMAARLGVRAHVVPDAGHSPATENPRATADLLTRLLTGRPAARAATPDAPADLSPPPR